MGQIIAFANQKGGSCKTTICVNLAAGLVKKRKKCLVIDCDPQGSASHHLGLVETQINSSLKDVLEGTLPIKEVIHTYEPGLDIVPSKTSLAYLQGKLETHHFKDALSPVKGKYDFILLDLPPAFGDLSLAPLSIANEVIFTVLGKSGLSMVGLTKISRTVEAVRDINPSLQSGGIIVCMISTRKTNIANEIAQYLKEHFGDAVYKTRIRETVKISEAATMGRHIFSHVGKKHNARQDFTALAAEFLRKHRKKGGK
jgi:chromosome partitioning protein